MFVLLLVNTEAAELFTFDLEKIKAGEFWRVFSYLFLPPIMPGGMFAILFMFFAVMISFMMSDAIESEWGVFKMSIYIYALALCQGIAFFTLSAIHPELIEKLELGGGMGLYFSLFITFAILFPHFKFHILMILPVSVWVLAAIIAVFTILGSIGAPIVGLFNFITFFPLLIWAVPYLIKLAKNNGQATIRRKSFEAKNRAREEEAFNECHICKQTEKDDPDLTFRVAPDGEEYCLKHLPE